MGSSWEDIKEAEDGSEEVDVISEIQNNGNLFLQLHNIIILYILTRNQVVLCGRSFTAQNLQLIIR